MVDQTTVIATTNNSLHSTLSLFRHSLAKKLPSNAKLLESRPKADAPCPYAPRGARFAAWALRQAEQCDTDGGLVGGNVDAAPCISMKIICRLASQKRREPGRRGGQQDKRDRAN